MGRNIGAAVVGYLAMFASVFVIFSILYLILGASGSFQPGSWDVSGVWVIASIVIGLVAGAVGGWVCMRVAGDMAAVKLLIGLVVVLGVVLAVMGGAAEAPIEPRPDDVALMEAMGSAAQPAWLSWLNPVLGAVGAWFGARLAKTPAATA